MKITVRSLIPAGAVLGAAMMFAAGAWAADAAAGKALYATKCKTCHGADGTPPAAMGKALGVQPLSASKGKSDGDIKDAILKGSGKMKPIAGITPAQADDLVAAVRSMQ